MKFFDLTKQNRKIKSEIERTISRVVGSGVYINGDEVKKFEDELASFCGTKYAISCNSGTDALLLSLKALGIGVGDEVITSPFSFIATASTIILAGAKPVFVDIDPKTLNLDPDLIEKSITKKTKAIIAVHIFGRMCPMDRICQIARKHKLKIIEDSAQSIGSAYKGKKSGAWGDVGCFSFFPTKNLGCFGDGGAVVTDHKELNEKVRQLKNHGSDAKNKYLHLEIGTNSRLDAIQAAVLSVKLKYLGSYNCARQKTAEGFNKSFRNVGDLIVPEFSESEHTFHQYTMRTKNRDALIRYLSDKGVPTMVYYPIPLHLQPALGSLGYKKGDFPCCEQACQEVISLPIWPELSTQDKNYIVKSVINYFEDYSLSK